MVAEDEVVWKLFVARLSFCKALQVSRVHMRVEQNAPPTAPAGFRGLALFLCCRGCYLFLHYIRRPVCGCNASRGCIIFVRRAVSVAVYKPTKSANATHACATH
jgi:hypothetical protein